jgi:hypothetical protein
MKVVGITSTYAAAALSEADAVVQELGKISIGLDGAPKLVVSIG